MSTSLTFVPPPADPRSPAALAELADLAVSSLPSPASRRNYGREVRRFLEWLFHAFHGGKAQSLSRECVAGYMQARFATGPNAGQTPTYNIALAAIKLLAREAQIRGWITETELFAIERIRSRPRLSLPTGNWTNANGVGLLLEAASRTKSPVRDRAIVACLVGCGLRRAEVTSLEWHQWQLREDRWCWVNVLGKGRRVRTVACPKWAAELINEWKGTTNDE